MPSPEIHYLLPNAAELAADADFTTLYRTSFPRKEREPIPVIGRSIASERGPVLLARHAGRTVGLASAHLVQDPSLAFLVYLAVAPHLRRHGIGSALFERLWQIGTERGAGHGRPPGGIVWEVDAPHLAASDSERAARVARIEFFRRLGGEVWLETYVQPPVSGAPVPMLLMGRCAPGAPRPPIEAVVRGIYFEKYGAANGIDRGILEKLLGRSLGQRS